MYMSSKKQEIDMETFTMTMDKSLEESIKTDIKNVSEFKIDEGIFGKLAIITGIISFIPIMYQIWKTKDTRNFTHKNLLLAIFSNIMWIVYGIKGNTSANLWSGLLYLSIYCYIMIFKVIY